MDHIKTENFSRKGVYRKTKQSLLQLFVVLCTQVSELD